METKRKALPFSDGYLPQVKADQFHAYKIKHANVDVKWSRKQEH